MQCPRCRVENVDGARFCEDCGARLELACPSCGQPVGIGKKFCRSCGALLAAQGSALTSPESYTPKHLVEKILGARGSLEGERKHVTVLFADLKGSMELLADRDPEEARKLLDPVLERMMDAVHRYEGTVNQVMGDGIMALFGAPLAHEDHAVRACYAALQMQESVARYAETLRRTEAVGAHIRVGLNSGEVVVRSVGSDLRMDYSAVGQTTHLAARLEQMASPGSTFITAGTLRLAEGHVTVRPLGPIQVKGLPEPVDVYELTGAVASRTRFQVAATRGLSRFVGRDAEIDQLRRALAQAGQGHGQIAAIIGEAGIGKSRLVHELIRSHRVHGWLILESGSVSYGRASPWLPVIDLLKAYFRIEERDDHRGMREKVTGKLLTLDRALEPMLPVLLSLLQVPVNDPAWTALDPLQRRQRTLDAVRQLLLREARAQPLLVVFEDLHWIDSESQAFLDALVESLPAARLLLLVNYRPEYQHGWATKSYYTQLRLDALPEESAGELLAALLGDDPTLAPLKALLIDRTRGNPFFVEESVRTLVEARALAGERGAYGLTHPVETIQVPETVHAILAARIDRLSPADTQLLQSAAVVGTEVPLPLLQAVAEMPDEDLRRGLARLQAAEYLYETSLYPEVEYTFKHALTHEVAYASLLLERRRVLHARILSAIEERHADRLSEHVERLGHHAVRAESWDKAVDYLQQAGLKAAGRSAYRQAAAAFDEALTALGHLPETREILGASVDLRNSLRNVLTPLDELDRALDHLTAALPQAERLGDRTRLGWVLSGLANTLFGVGETRHAVEQGVRALDLASRAEDAGLRATTLYRLGAGHYTLGDFGQARERFRQGLAWAAGDQAVHLPIGTTSVPGIVSRCWLAITEAETGSFPEAIRLAEEAVRLAPADQPFSRFPALWGLGHVRLRRGDLDQAAAALEEGLEIGRTWNIVNWYPICAATLGLARTLGGRHPEGLALLENAVQSGSRFLHAPRIAWLSEAYLHAGRVDEARSQAAEALDRAVAYGERGHEAWIRRLHGDIAASSADVETAQRHYVQALELAAELGMRPLVAHCHLALGRLHRARGNRAQAEEHLARAVALYREMDIPAWLETAQAELE
jgi:class 3 adenylate cyclase/tetratricopeptide (TPR) repeat protein